eukprot:2982608-Amphidinium_carterae.2
MTPRTLPRLWARPAPLGRGDWFPRVPDNLQWSAASRDVTHGCTWHPPSATAAAQTQSRCRKGQRPPNRAWLCSWLQPTTSMTPRKFKI